MIEEIEAVVIGSGYPDVSSLQSNGADRSNS